jgi:pyrimidine-nucleoside phosphorylase
VLRGSGPADTVGLTVELGAQMLVVGGTERTVPKGRARIEAALRDGTALTVFRKMVEAHGGDPRVVDDPSRLPAAPYRVPVLAAKSGFVRAVDALLLGQLSVKMGAGRSRADQPVDHAVGIELAVRPGHRASRGEPLCFLHVRDEASGSEWARAAAASITLGKARPRVSRLVIANLS